MAKAKGDAIISLGHAMEDDPMKTIPTDEAVLDALFQAISGQNSLVAHISNNQPNTAVSHDSDEVVTRFEKNVDRYVDTVVRAGRRFRDSTK